MFAMTARLRALVAVVGVSLAGCATQQATAQALTVAGAAALVLGASMAADEHCHLAGPGDGGVTGYCAAGLSQGARNVGKGLAVAGVGLAATGYALTPKGPDRSLPAAAPRAPAAPYRLIRHAPPPEPEAPATPD